MLALQRIARKYIIYFLAIRCKILSLLHLYSYKLMLMLLDL